MRGILFFNFASCEPLNKVFEHLSVTGQDASFYFSLAETDHRDIQPKNKPKTPDTEANKSQPFSSNLDVNTKREKIAHTSDLFEHLAIIGQDLPFHFKLTSTHVPLAIKTYNH